MRRMKNHNFEGFSKPIIVNFKTFFYERCETNKLKLRAFPLGVL